MCSVLILYCSNIIIAIQDEITPDSETEFWVKDLGLLPEHHDDILFGKALSADIINVSHTVLSQQFPEVSGLQRTFFNARPSFHCATNGVQIHYTNEYHWVTSSAIGASKKCCARIFDSKWKEGFQFRQRFR